MYLFVIWTIILAVALHFFLKQKYSRFPKHGVNCLPIVPPFGTMWRLLLKREHFHTYVEKVYNAFPQDRFVGSYAFLRPIVFIRDLELIKNILIRDFEHFSNHATTIDVKTDSYFGKFLFTLKDQKWRDVRAVVSPAFTSSKIKLMVPFMVQVAGYMVDTVKKEIKKSGTNTADMEIRNLTIRYSMDVVATCAFGLKVQPNDENSEQFFKMGRAAGDYGRVGLFKILGLITVPKIFKKLLAFMVAEHVETFFRGIINYTIKERESKNIVRPDMIQMMMDASKGKLEQNSDDLKDLHEGYDAQIDEPINDTTKGDIQTYNEEDLMAQVFSFLVGGADTETSLLMFTLLEMAVNQDVQKKLYKEIKADYDKNGGKIDYNTFSQLDYLDLTVTEATRLWTQTFIVDRVCVKDYNLGRPNAQATEDYIIRKGEALNIPSYALHHSPEYFPDPNKFDPERFTGNKVKPFTFLPFGVGRRNCIGSRYVLFKAKVMLYMILLHLELLPSKKLCTPLRLTLEKPNHVLAHGGHWILFKPRT